MLEIESIKRTKAVIKRNVFKSDLKSGLAGTE